MGEHPRHLVSSKLICMTKIRSGDFVPKGIVFYECVIFFTERTKRAGKHGITQFYIGITDDGGIGALPSLTSEAQLIRHKRLSGPYATRTSWISHSKMALPSSLVSIVRNYNAEFGTRLTVNEHVAETLLMMIGITQSVETGATVNIAKGGLVGRFGVPANRTSHFFRDREAARPGERRRPIFHQVQEYSYWRGAREVTVGQHFRGLEERQFRWRDYAVAITVPDFHHVPLSAMTHTVVEYDDGRPLPAGMVLNKEVGRRLEERIWNSPDRPH
jgi:hypothetical protein